MVRPQQRVILYRNGMRSKTPAQYQDEYNSKKEGYFQCPKCKRHVKKGAEGNLKRHYADFPNRIKCPAGIDPQCVGNGHPGGPRGPYKKRTQPNVSDDSPMDALDFLD